MEITKEILKESIIGKKRGAYDLLVSLYERQAVTMAVPILISYIERDLGLIEGVLKKQSIYTALKKRAKNGQKNKPGEASGSPPDSQVSFNQAHSQDTSVNQDIPEYKPKDPFEGIEF